MADFIEAYTKTMDNEGGFQLTNRPGDLGRMTYAGISRRYHPRWYGWKLIDKGIASKAALEPHVKPFYRKEFWNKICGDQIVDQGVAESIYDFAVNVDPVDAAKLAQAVVDVKRDGIIGPITLGRLNWMSADMFRIRFFVGKIAWYANICNKKPSQKENLLGWVNRSLKEVRG